MGQLAVQRRDVRPSIGRVAVLYRGPVRPSASSFLSKMKEFSAALDQHEIEYENFIATWSDQASIEAMTALQLAKTSLMAIVQPTEPEIMAKVSHAYNATGGFKRNIYWQYYLSKIATCAIACMSRYDYVIHTRTDISVELGTSLFDWFEKGVYSTIHTKEDGFINDQFAVAETAVMEAAWDYGSDANLIRMIEFHDKAENILQEMVERRRIESKRKNLMRWELDVLRK